jgi:hypothetical protein
MIRNLFKKYTSRICFTVLAVVIFIGTVAPAIEVFAQLQPLNGNVVNTTDPTSPGYDQTNTATQVDTPGGNASKDLSGAPAVPEAKGCRSLFTCTPYALLALLANIVMWIVAMILFFAGLILDTALYFTIHLKDIMASVPVVDIGWTIFRDLANICFIFILLWIAISTIIGLNSGKTKELLVHLIIVALLMNFSLFITKAVVDASNIVAIHFYNLIVPPGTEGGGSGANPIGRGSFSGAFMEGLQLQTLYSSGAATGATEGSGVGAAIGSLLTKGVLDFLKIIIIAVLGSGLMLVAAYVFFVAALLLIMRIVVLMFVMILSPLAFLAFILPSTEKYAEQWKESLITQSMFAPLYLALAYVVVKTIQSPAFKAVLSLGSSPASGGIITSAGGIIVNFIILIALMLGCILIAKKMEAYGHEGAIDLGKMAGGFVGRTIARGTYLTPVARIANTFGLGSATQYMGEKLQKIPGVKRVGEGLSTLGKNMKTEEGREKLQKAIDINELNKKFEQSKFGASELGSFIREKTTGGSLFGVGAKFGAEKSVHESYEESEKLKNRRFAIEKMEEAEASVKRLEIARANQLPDLPDWQNKKYKDAKGNFDQAKFDADFAKFAERFKPRLSSKPVRADYANTPDGEKEFKAAEMQYSYEQTPTGQAEFTANLARYESVLKRQPKRANYTGPNADEDFAKDQKIFENNFTKAPDPSHFMYSSPVGKLFYAQDKKIFDDGQNRKAKADKEVEAATAAVGYAMNQVAAEEFANMDEHRIHNMARRRQVS